MLACQISNQIIPTEVIELSDDKRHLSKKYLPDYGWFQFSWDLKDQIIFLHSKLLIQNFFGFFTYTQFNNWFQLDHDCFSQFSSIQICCWGYFQNFSDNLKDNWSQLCEDPKDKRIAISLTSNIDYRWVQHLCAQVLSWVEFNSRVILPFFSLLIMQKSMFKTLLCQPIWFQMHMKVHTNSLL